MFRIHMVSGIIKNEELNQFESSVVIRSRYPVNHELVDVDTYERHKNVEQRNKEHEKLFKLYFNLLISENLPYVLESRS